MTTISAYLFSSKIEVDGAAEMAKILKAHQFKSDQGSLQKAIEELVSTSESYAKSQQSLHSQVIKELEGPIFKFREEQRKLKKQLEAELENNAKVVSRQDANLTKAKANYFEKCGALSAAIKTASKGQTGSMTKKEFQKIQEKAIKAKKDLDAAEHSYNESLHQMQQAQDVWIAKMKETAVKVRDSEKVRLQITKASVRKILEFQAETLNASRAKFISQAREAFASVDVDADLDHYCRTLETGTLLPPRPTFQSYFNAAAQESVLPNPTSVENLTADGAPSAAAPTATQTHASTNPETEAALLRLKSKLKNGNSNAALLGKNATSPVAGAKGSAASLEKSIEGSRSQIDSVQEQNEGSTTIAAVKTNSFNAVQEEEVQPAEQQHSRQSSTVAQEAAGVDNQKSVHDLKSKSASRGDLLNQTAQEEAVQPRPSLSEDVAPRAMSAAIFVDTGKNGSKNDLTLSNIKSPDSSLGLSPSKPLNDEFVAKSNPLAAEHIHTANASQEMRSEIVKNEGLTRVNSFKKSLDNLLRNPLAKSKDNLFKKDSQASLKANEVLSHAAHVQAQPISVHQASVVAHDALPNGAHGHNHAQPIVVQKAEIETAAPAALEIKAAPAPVEAKPTFEPTVENKIAPASVEALPAAEVASPAQPTDAIDFSAELPKLTFLRRSIKMESAIKLYENGVNVNGEWTSCWCVLEGGYIWVYENQEDANKPQGSAKPKAMLSLSKCVFSRVCDAELKVPNLASQSAYVFSLVIGAKRQMAFAVPEQKQYIYWVQNLDAIINKKK
eukprot:Partr_v1_DN27143_c0_g1_i3_m15398 putative proline-serine-threonine phosphatase interacting protein